MTGCHFALLALLPACSLEIAPSLEGMECARYRRYDFPAITDGCVVRTSGPKRCYLLPVGEPCADEPEVFYAGQDYESWCDVGNGDNDPILTREVECHD